MTPDELEAIRERVNAATPGPWTAHDDGLVWPERMGDPVSGSVQLEDAEFIAAARSDVPALLADLDAAREALRQAQATVADLLSKRDAWQRRAEEATLRDGQILAEKREVEADRDRMRPVVEAVGAWADPDAAWAGDIRETPQDLALLAAWDTYETQEGTE